VHFGYVAEMEQIESLEKELKEAKMKCAQLSSYLETRKKQKIADEQTEKV
jgi:DNA topoisomerase VI subunit B